MAKSIKNAKITKAVAKLFGKRTRTHFTKSTKGNAAPEYAILAAAVGIALMVAIDMTGTQVSCTANTVTETLNDDQGALAACAAQAPAQAQPQAQALPTPPAAVSAAPSAFSVATAPTSSLHNFDFVSSDDAGTRHTIVDGRVEVEFTLLRRRPGQSSEQAPGLVTVKYDDGVVGSYLVDDMKSASPSNVSLSLDGEGNIVIEGRFSAGNAYVRVEAATDGSTV